MKSKVETNSTPSLNCPVLMKAVESDLVVLFTGTTEGIVVNPSSGYYHSAVNVGDVMDNWPPLHNEEWWVRFEGRLILEND